LQAIDLLLIGLVPLPQHRVIRLFLLHLIKHLLFVLDQLFVILPLSLQLLFFGLDLDLLIVEPVLQLLVEV